jgi:hypothetical protein
MVEKSKPANTITEALFAQIICCIYSRRWYSVRMKKRPIKTVADADAAMERLGWLKSMGSPNADVRELWECAVTYRSAIHRQEDAPKKRWRERVGK